jgi:alkylated DNA repair dioxygenase AlkB
VLQVSLFDPAEGVLVDDERGRVEYTRRFVTPAVARAWFDELRAAVAWRSERRHMYDREVDVPRLTAHFALDGADDAGLPPALRQAAEEVSRRTAVPFNSVGLNLYRDGRDSVAPHNDHLDEIAEGFPIALVSLGATRRMTIRARPPQKQVLHVDLDPGSLLLMSYATQLHTTHAIPKTGEAVGERISLAFRVSRGERTPEGSQPAVPDR